jgi:molybdopterin molybdotransferase
MPEFLTLVPPRQALEKFLSNLPHKDPVSEIIALQNALGRVLAHAVHAPHPLPPFDRSTVDGYAVRAADTFGASQTLPAYLGLVGEVKMGAKSSIQLEPGQAAVVHTGGMIPSSADAVVMLEDTQSSVENEIEVLKPVAVGQNVLKTGEDVQAGDVVLPAGLSLRPQEIGGLAGLGLTQIEVVRRPQVGILSTGDEVVPPEDEPSLGQVRDINSYTLAALTTRLGGRPVLHGIIPDQYPKLLAAARKAHAENDIIIITAGSSVSERDMTARVISELGEPGVLVHGVSIKPGKPTILAVAGGKPIIGLPGNPVSALVIAGLFLPPLMRKLMGAASTPRQPTADAKLTLNIASETGREDYLPVRLVQVDNELQAEPVFGRSNLIFTLVRADGLVRIPPESTGLAAGSNVRVDLF